MYVNRRIACTGGELQDEPCQAMPHLWLLDVCCGIFDLFGLLHARKALEIHQPEFEPVRRGLLQNQLHFGCFSAAGEVFEENAVLPAIFTVRIRHQDCGLLDCLPRAVHLCADGDRGAVVVSKADHHAALATTSITAEAASGNERRRHDTLQQHAWLSIVFQYEPSGRVL